LSVVYLGEGEPTLAKRFFELVDYNHSQSLTSVVFSNASLLTKDIIQSSFEKDVSFNFNIPSLKKDVFAKLTGNKKSFKTVLLNLDSVADVYASGDQRVAINFVLNKDNLVEFDDMVKYCDQRGFILNPGMLSKCGFAEQNWIDLVGSEENYTTMAALKKSFTDVDGQSSAVSGACGFSAKGVTFDPDGFVMGCPQSDELKTNLGNVFKDDFLKTHLKKQKLIEEIYGPVMRCFDAFSRLYSIPFNTALAMENVRDDWTATISRQFLKKMLIS